MLTITMAIMTPSRVVYTLILLKIFAILRYVCTQPNLLVRPVSEIPGNTEAFRVIWNSPTQKCRDRFGVWIDVEKYGIVENQGGNWMGDVISLFYSSKFGLFPYYDKQGQPVNGGLPQLGNLTAHLEKIHSNLPDPTFKGLGVIDWEEWRPVWDRNLDTKLIYQQKSRELVKARHPDWPKSNISFQAKKEFEAAAKLYMESSLELVRQQRPAANWGYYGFPRCYNYGGKHPYCSQKTIKFNDRLHWLYNAGSALYPSAYLSSDMYNASAFVHGQIMESRRVRGKSKIPIYLYSRYRTEDDGKFYTKELLDASILQAANAGLDGVILWGSSLATRTPQSCIHIQSYLHTTLGPYVANIINKTKQCSLELCSGGGRCVDTSILSQESTIQDFAESLSWKLSDILTYWSHFTSWATTVISSFMGKNIPTYTCECYQETHGTSCQR